MKQLVTLLLFVIIANTINAQSEADSIKVATTLEEIFTVCNSSEPEAAIGNEQIIFERLAPYILCMSYDENRNKKMASDYNIPYDRRMTDQLGGMIKKWLDNYDSYKIGTYMTQTKDNGESWHALNVVFSRGEKKEKVIFAFLKLGDSYLLGDID
jgi:hypothetical protein